MIKTHRPNLNQIAISTLLALGAILTILSGFYLSSFLAILGLALIFWGIILLYITPTRQVPLTLLNHLTDASNTERILEELELKSKAIYLPPKNLKNIESNLIFIPQKPQTPLPSPEEINNKLLNKTKEAVFLSPPGEPLCKLFEQEIGNSFTKLNLPDLQTKLPKLLVEDLEIAENAELQISQNNTNTTITITITITNSIFDHICQQTQSQPRTYNQIGCILTSAIACALTKTTGQPIIINQETTNPQTKTTKTEYITLTT